MKPSAKPEILAILTPRQIYERLDKFVIGQERAKRVVAIAAYNHLKRCELRKTRRASTLKKSNILLIGPTGSGKTHLARNLAEILSVPLSIADATEFTEAGYYGKDVEVMVAELLFKANHSIEDTQRGIIFIDEIDKIARRSQSARNGAGSRDIGGEGVQQALLKVLEGREIFVPLNVTQHWNKHDFVQVNTSDILFICAGTFSDLHGYQGEKNVGFGSERKEASRVAAGRPRQQIGLKDLLDYGMLAELMGRLPVLVQLDELGAGDLFQVLTVPPDSLAREYRELLSHEEIELDLTEGALQEVARFAFEKHLGARGLRGIFEELMSDVMFTAPEERGSKVKIDRAFACRRLEAMDVAALKEG